jgi:hypothetical protein
MFKLRTGMTSVGAACIGLTIGGCTNTPSNASAPTPTGRTHVVGCGGPSKTWADCAQIAAGECGSAGYDVIKRSTPSTTPAAMPKDPAVADGFQAPVDDPNDRWMKVMCRPP